MHVLKDENSKGHSVKNTAGMVEVNEELSTRSGTYLGVAHLVAKKKHHVETTTAEKARKKHTKAAQKGT